MQMPNWYINGTLNGIFRKPQKPNPLVLLGWQGSSVGESAGFIILRSLTISVT